MPLRVMSVDILRLEMGLVTNVLTVVIHWDVAKNKYIKMFMNMNTCLN
jgi:hypothetical protein